MKVIILFAIVLFTASADARDFYVSPTGGGSACSADSPCTYSTACRGAGPGDTISLMDGTYSAAQGVPFRTCRSGEPGRPITITAQNRYKAIVQWPYPGSDDRYGQTIDLLHSHIILDGIVVDGLRASWDAVRIFGGGSHGSPQSVGVVVQNMHVHDLGRTCFGIFNTDGAIVRGNLCERSGYQGPGEGFYISSNSRRSPTTKAEIYGNVIRETTNNLADFKHLASGVDVHHNVFEKTQPPRNSDGASDGLVRSSGFAASKGGNKFRDNIVRQAFSSYGIRTEGNRVDVRNNVFQDLDIGYFVDSRTRPTSTVVVGNTLCNTNSENRADVVFRDNLIDDSGIACDKEIARVRKEIDELLGKVPPPTPLPEDRCAWEQKVEDEQLIITIVCELD